MKLKDCLVTERKSECEKRERHKRGIDLTGLDGGKEQHKEQ